MKSVWNNIYITTSFWNKRTVAILSGYSQAEIATRNYAYLMPISITNTKVYIEPVVFYTKKGGVELMVL